MFDSIGIMDLMTDEQKEKIVKRIVTKANKYIDSPAFDKELGEAVNAVVKGLFDEDYFYDNMDLDPINKTICALVNEVVTEKFSS